MNENFDKILTQIKEIRLEEIWNENKEKGIIKLFLIHNSVDELIVECKCNDYEVIRRKSFDCDVDTFAVILTFLIFTGKL